MTLHYDLIAFSCGIGLLAIIGLVFALKKDDEDSPMTKEAYDVFGPIVFVLLIIAVFGSLFRGRK